VFLNVAPKRPWDQAKPESFTPEVFRAIVEAVGTRGHDRLRVGASFVFSILEDEPSVLARALRNLLDSARAADVPVLVTFDGQNWWQNRPDLWNFWDPALPGYDPANRANVEWTDWTPDSAVKIGWRNWGRQMRVRPAPNLASRRFLEAHWPAYDVLVPMLVRWREELPADRKHLFGGLKVGWEASINVNAYHYPGGNRLFEQWPDDPSHDPNEHDPAKGWTFGHAVLGHAAVRTAGIKSDGELAREDVERVVQQYLEALAGRAVGLGLPAGLVFTHQGGTFAPWDRHLSFRPAMNRFSIPGWSFYSHDPPECGSLAEDMESQGRTQWAAAEWWRGAADEKGWQERFARTLAFKRCRFICVFNWHGFEQAPGATAGLRRVIEQRR
jgi:hypothetical protein